MAVAQAFGEKFEHFEWPPLLNALSERVNPILKTVQAVGFGGYDWVADQAEFATDIMFKDRANLEAYLPDLFEHAILKSACQDVLRFLGRKLHGNFKGEVTTSLKKRPEGWRDNHTLKRNSLKIYDKSSVLRVETTINNPSEFIIWHHGLIAKVKDARLYRITKMGSQVLFAVLNIKPPFHTLFRTPNDLRILCNC